MITVYAIRDKVANAIVGGLHLFKADAVAVRFFSDIASDPQTMVARHINDHDLIAVATMDEDGTVHPSVDGVLPLVIITGASFKAAADAKAAAEAEANG